MHTTTNRPHHRRFQGYDYSRGASLFITVVTEPRCCLFGSVCENGVLLSPFGEIVKQELFAASEHFPSVLLKKWVVMPDHVHFRIYLPPGTEEPIQLIGAFVGRFKQFSQWRISQSGGPVHIWEKGYHDHICLSREMIDAIDRYIDNNPLKWRLMHGDKSLMPIHEPLDDLWLPADAFWRGVGKIELGEAPSFVALRVSRKVAPQWLGEVADTCVKGARKGYVYVSTFFSPGEHAVYRAVANACDAPMVCLRHEAIDWGYRPRGDEPELFAAKRLMVVARMEATDEPAKRPDLLWLNGVASRIALETGGKAVYVRGDSDGRPVYDVTTA